MNAPTKHTLGKEQSLCTGCTACAAICPVDAITMRPNGEGFMHPLIQADACTDCGLCRKICPINSCENGGINKWANNEVSSVFAAWNLDENVRYKSSSGGIFTALTEDILEKGGAAVGAAFDSRLTLRHCIIESKTDLHRLQGSKYLQSEITPELYRKVLHLLKQGRSVLFSGTPCQVAGMIQFIPKQYDNFYCCDLVCMGVPSPLLFNKYLNWKNSKSKAKISSCGFRDKAFGWKSPSMMHGYSDGNSECAQKSAYYLAFIKRIALRLSCYDCHFKGLNRTGDVTLADFWGVAKRYPEYDQDDKGTSLVLVNNSKGKNWLNECRSRLFVGSADIDTAIIGNPMLSHSAQLPSERETFYQDLCSLTFKMIVSKYRLSRPLFYQRAYISLRRRLNKMKSKLIDPNYKQGECI